MKKIFAAAAMMFALASCGTQEPIETLENKVWKLNEMEGLAAETINDEDDAFTLEFFVEEDQTKVAGRSNCNNIMGLYEVEGSALKFKQMASTMMACPDMEAEDAFNAMLEQVSAYSIEEGVLTLKAGDAVLATFKAQEKAEQVQAETEQTEEIPAE